MINFGLNWAGSTLAQVNFGGGTHTLLGILLAVAGAALYFLRSVRPELSRDHDIFFAAIGLACGIILISQGWRLDPILEFGQVLLIGSTVFFAVESIRLRGIATEQAKRNTRIVDDERPASNYYQQAEIDEVEEFDYDRPVRPRIPGSRDSRDNRLDEYYEDESPRRPTTRRSENYDDEPPIRRSSNRGSVDKIGQGDKPRKRRSSSTRVETRYQDEWDSPKNPDEEWRTTSSSSANSAKKRSRPNNNAPIRSSSSEDLDTPSPRPRKRRPTQDPVQPARDDEAIPTDYVDYKPIDRSNDDPDSSTDFDQF